MNACCPLCRQVRPVFIDDGRLFYVDHTAGPQVRRWCEASGWLVEDDELVTKRIRPPHRTKRETT